MKHILTILLLISAISIYAQKQGQERVDSLLTELEKAETDTTKVNILNEVSRQNISFGNYEIAMEQAEKALLVARNAQFKKGEADAHSSIGIIYSNQGNYPEALKNHLALLKISEETENKANMASAHMNIGIVYAIQGNYPEALKFFLNALKIFEEIGNKNRTASTYGNIGNIYRIQGNYREALKNHQAALKIFEIIEDKRMIASCYINIGNIYVDQDNYPEALKNHQAALRICEEVGAKREQALSSNNIGGIYRKQGNYAEALKSLFASLKISEQIGHKELMAMTYSSIGFVYEKLGELRESEKWLYKSLQLGKEIGMTDNTRDTYEALARTDSAQGNYKGAFENYKMYTAYKDSLFNEENTKELTRLEMNYGFEKQQDSIRLLNEKEIAIRDASIANVRRQRLFFIGGIFALTIIGGLLYYQSKQRKKHNEKLHLLNTELDQANRIKTRFFSILNHDLRSPVANLIHFLHLQNENPELLDRETKERLQGKTISGAENLLASMEDLLLWSKGQMENFKPEPKQIQIKQLFEDNKKVFSGYQNIHFEYHNPDNLEVFTDLNYLKTIVRNLTSNAINVFTTTENPTIIWEARQENGRILLSVTDNGPGADSKKFRALYDDKEVVGIKSGLGLHLIRDLAKAIGCVIEVESTIGKGTTIRLLF